jgi:hypothetical protein
VTATSDPRAIPVLPGVDVYPDGTNAAALHAWFDTKRELRAE